MKSNVSIQPGSQRVLSLFLLFLVVSISSAAPASGTTASKPNILFITADDMNHDSAGCYGCPIRDLTPNLDRLASEGIMFQYAYSTVAVCQPVRGIMHTGMYPHRNGAMGFFPLKPEVRTLNQQIHDAGYLISMLGKNSHYMPAENFCVDFAETGISRSPAQLAAATKKFLGMARGQKRPFFHHVNCTDPHRGFIGGNGPDDLAHGDAPSRWIKPEELSGVPGFLEDLPAVRTEMAQYYTSVRRLDDCVGAVLQALKDEGFADNTIVMFYGGDHGMALPFAKSNDYEDSSRGALILRWPGVIKPGSVDRDHLVSTLDFTPTLLDAARLPAIPDIDGRSFLPALHGEKMAGWDRVFTFYNQSSGGSWLPMRCIRTKDRSYIWNAWSDGTMEYQAENMGGLTWKAMIEAAGTNPGIKARCDFYLHRVPEEFYDMTDDRYERNNLIANPARQAEIESMRSALLELMQRTGDPLAEAFARRDKPEILAEAKQKLIDEYGRRRKAGKANTAKTKGSPAAPAPGAADGVLVLEPPASLHSGQPATLKIRHRLPADQGSQTISITVKSGTSRLERKTIEVAGDGVAEVAFAIPVEAEGQQVSFAAFVGTDFSKTPTHALTIPQPVQQ